MRKASGTWADEVLNEVNLKIKKKKKRKRGRATDMGERKKGSMILTSK